MSRTAGCRPTASTPPSCTPSRGRPAPACSSCRGCSGWRAGPCRPGSTGCSAAACCGWSPQVDPAALGFPVTAFLTLELHQGTGRDEVTEQLSGVPQVLEAHTTTGAGDLLVRVVARDNTHLQEVIDTVVATPAVARTSTVIALQDVVRHRTLPLLEEAVRPRA